MIVRTKESPLCNLNSTDLMISENLFENVDGWTDNRCQRNWCTLEHSAQVYMGKIIRIYHECEGRIAKSIPRIAIWHHLTRIMDSFSNHCFYLSIY